jgi:hypothetical protein
VKVVTRRDDQRRAVRLAGARGRVRLDPAAD